MMMYVLYGVYLILGMNENEWIINIWYDDVNGYLCFVEFLFYDIFKIMCVCYLFDKILNWMVGVCILFFFCCIFKLISISIFFYRKKYFFFWKRMIFMIINFLYVLC